jgi:hypothetical protein
LFVGALRLDNAAVLFGLAAILVGAQMTMFYVVAKLYAVSERLLPATDGSLRLRRLLTVDRLCLAGAVLFMTGLATAVAAVVRWAYADFGDLDPSWIVRLAGLATAGMALGVQVITTSFLIELVCGRLTARETSIPVHSRPEQVNGPASSGTRAAA